MVQKSLKFPLLPTTLSENDCRKIEHPELNIVLKSASLPSNIPQDALFGQPKYLGQQGDSHISTLPKDWNTFE
eukprot:4329380-Ditylum_brightwellii.AAC.1